MGRKFVDALLTGIVS